MEWYSDDYDVRTAQAWIASSLERRFRHGRPICDRLSIATDTPMPRSKIRMTATV
jgi:hypothetical protein